MLRFESKRLVLKEALDSHNPKGKAKLLMKKRARQKRHEYSLFPPIAHGQTLRKDTQTSFNTHVDDNELALVNGHNISRVNDVTTPYVMHSNYSHKIETMSPVPNHVKELFFNSLYLFLSSLSTNPILFVFNKSLGFFSFSI
jgi:hypothetical protein